MADTTIKPFKINVPQPKIDRLKQKLALYDLPPPEVEGERPWTRGVPFADLKRIVDYWVAEYDWRKTETKLNEELPQFTTEIEIDGFGIYNVHFVHQRSKVGNAIPLVFLHGWPGQFSEVQKILPLLVAGDGENVPAFHVVAPSFVNFGFSDRCTKSGFNVRKHGETVHKLMLRLGYDKYVCQGGDLGSFVARNMVQYYQSSVCGYLLNLAGPREPTKERDPELWAKYEKNPLTEKEKQDMEWVKAWTKEGMAYYQIQATKPMTLGYSMADSPVGLLAWIYEKLKDWSDDYPWTPEEVLQWVLLYQFSKPGPNATQQIYYDAIHFPDTTAPDAYSSVPLGMARFPRELNLNPKIWHETMGPLVYWGEHKHGGHFAAWEQPEELVEDLRTMFGKHGGATNCCGEGSTGYKVEKTGTRSKL